jgi:hypothetical protein
MNPGENSGVLSLATLDAALEALHAELAATRALLRDLERQVHRLRVEGPKDTALHVVAALPTDDLMSSADRQLNTAQAAAFLGVKKTWLRKNKHKIRFTKDGDARSTPLFFSLGDLKAYNERRRTHLPRPADARLPPPIYITKPKPPRPRHTTKPARTVGRRTA